MSPLHSTQGPGPKLPKHLFSYSTSKMSRVASTLSTACLRVWSCTRALQLSVSILHCATGEATEDPHVPAATREEQRGLTSGSLSSL